jgi:phosphatidylserine decarboxylase
MIEIIKQGWKVFLITLVMAFVLLACSYAFSQPVLFWAASLPLFVFFYTIFFLRIPCRTIQKDDNVIYASADGYVFDIQKDVNAPVYLEGKVHKIVIFMHVASVHWNLSPIDGIIEHESYHPGEFKNVMKASAWDVNEHQFIGLKHRTKDFKVLITMIAGLIARRIVYFKKKNDKIGQGERFGLIKYGSANIIYVPSSFEVTAVVGQKSRAGKTMVARSKS